MNIKKKDMFKGIIICLLFHLTIPFICLPGHAEVIWENNWNNSIDWKTPLSTNILGLKNTHDTAIKTFNASSYRHSSVEDIHILEISPAANRGGEGKGLIYRFKGINTWLAASIDLAFCDPNIKWATTKINRMGYTDLWYSVWYKSPVPLDFSTAGNDSDNSYFRLWKACRFYAYDLSKYLLPSNGDNPNDPNAHWNRLMSQNESLSSHYLEDTTIYKKPFFIPSWCGITLYWYPQFLRESDPDGGTSNIFYSLDRNNYNTHLLSGINWWEDGDKSFNGILADLQWHLFEYHIKLNDLGTTNDIQEVYIDGALVAISEVGNNKNMRDTDVKIHQVILFDNYFKMESEGCQPLYMDDMVVSTTRVGLDYIIGQPSPPKNLKIEASQQ